MVLESLVSWRVSGFGTWTFWKNSTFDSPKTAYFPDSNRHRLGEPAKQSVNARKRTIPSYCWCIQYYPIRDNTMNKSNRKPGFLGVYWNIWKNKYGERRLIWILETWEVCLFLPQRQGQSCLYPSHFVFSPKHPQAVPVDPLLSGFSKGFLENPPYIYIKYNIYIYTVYKSPFNSGFPSQPRLMTLEAADLSHGMPIICRVATYDVGLGLQGTCDQHHRRGAVPTRVW